MNQEFISNPDACAWRNGHNCIKIQFRDSALSRKFQRSGVQFECVGYGVAGGYLRMFTVERKTLNWFKRWTARNQTSNYVSDIRGG